LEVGRELSGVRILIVEDDFYQAFHARLLLQEAGAIVVALAPTVAEATQELEQKIDMVLLDIDLKREDSLALARRLKAEGVPFVFVTGFDRSYIPSDLRFAPALLKPVLWDEAICRLREIVVSGIDH
jgi:CheY-like chemotaxis protein